MVSTYLDAVTSLDTHDRAFAARVSDIAKLGDDDIRASAQVSNRLLEKPMAEMSQGGISQASNVTKSLLSLRKTVEDLDPQKQGNLLSPRKLLGVIPYGDRLADYFHKYQSSQGHINAIIVSLYDGQDELRRDNADIEQEKVNLWTTMGRLRQYAYLAEQLDKGLTAKIAEIEATDPDRAKTLKEDLLFPVRQKRQDLLTQLAVSVQGYLALDLIRRNNVELIKGVDRGDHYDRQCIAHSGHRCPGPVRPEAGARPDHGAQRDDRSPYRVDLANAPRAIHPDQRAGRLCDGSSLARLQKAFQNIYATMDEIDTFKVKALDNMEQTINALSTEIDKSKTYIDRVRAAEQAHAEGPPNTSGPVAI